MANSCKFQIEKQQVSYNNGQTWEDTGESRKIEGREPVERYSTDCGWSDSFLYRWVDVSGEYMCNGYHKYTKKRQEVSYNLGTDWEVVEGSDQIGTLVEKFSSDCCQLRTVTGETCDELFRKVNVSIEEASLDGETWIQTGRYTTNSIISAYSPDCLATADVKYLGIPVSGASGSSFFSYNFYDHRGSYYDEQKHIHSNYVIIGCDRDHEFNRKDYYDVGNIEEIYIGDCANNPSFNTQSLSTLKKIHISSGVSGTFGSLREATVLEEVEGLGNSRLTWFNDYSFMGSALKEITFPETCEYLGWYVCSGCTSLSSVTFYTKSMSGGNNSNGQQFARCTALKTATFPNDYKGVIYSSMFYECTSLSAVTLGNPTAIRDSAFRGCTSLTSIDLGDSVEGIGQYAFAGCIGLTDVYVRQKNNILSSVYSTTFPSGCIIHVVCEAYPYWHQAYEIDHPDLGVSIEAIDNDCRSERWVESGTTCVGYDKYNQQMKQYSYDSGETWYNTDEFRSGSTLIEHNSVDCGYVPGEYTSLVTFNDGSSNSLTTCEQSTSVPSYHYSHTVETITIGTCARTIPNGTFNECASATSLTFYEGVTSIGNYAFGGCLSLTNINIPNSVTSIGDSAFNGCISLSSVTIGSGVTSIGKNAFNSCRSLTSVTIPSGVTSIGMRAFWDCSNLQNIYIPDSVTSIGDSAFFRCLSLTSIIINATTPPTLGSDVFEYTNDSPIFVPASSVEAYKTAWSTYASRIQPIT